MSSTSTSRARRAHYDVLGVSRDDANDAEKLKKCECECDDARSATTREARRGDWR
jgi:hypothetical protein